MSSFDFPKMNGPFQLSGEAYKGIGTALTLPDGTQVIIVATTIEGIGSALDALQWEDDFDVEKCKPVAIGHAANLIYIGDDIPF